PSPFAGCEVPAGVGIRVRMLYPGSHNAGGYVSSVKLRALLMALVDIGSLTGGEIGLAQDLVAPTRRAAMRTELRAADAARPTAALATDVPVVDGGRENAVGHGRGRAHGLNLLFTGHMHTSYSGQEEHLTGEGFQPKAIYLDGWGFGFGANNMKSGLAAVLIA